MFFPTQKLSWIPESIFTVHPSGMCASDPASQWKSHSSDEFPGPSAGLIGPGTAAVNAAPQTARPVKQVAPPVLHLGAAAVGMVDFG